MLLSDDDNGNGDDDSETISNNEFSVDGDKQSLKEGEDFDDDETNDSNGSSDCNDQKKKVARTK